MFEAIRNRLAHRALHPTDRAEVLQTKNNRIADQITLTKNSDVHRNLKLITLRENPDLATELSTAAASSEKKLAHFTKYTSPWSTESRTEGYPRIKRGTVTLSPHKGVRVYWAEKIDNTFNTQLTLKHKSCNGGFYQAQHKVGILDKDIAERMINTSSRVTVEDLRLAVSIPKQKEVIDIRKKENSVFIKKMDKNNKKIDANLATQDKAQHLREGALSILTDKTAMDYVNKKAATGLFSSRPALQGDVDPSKAKVWAHSREGIAAYINAALTTQSDTPGVYSHTAHLSEENIQELIKFEHSQKHYKPTTFITASSNNDTGVEGDQHQNALFIITGKPYVAAAYDGADNVFKPRTPFIIESVTRKDGTTHVKMREFGVPKPAPIGGHA